MKPATITDWLILSRWRRGSVRARGVETDGQNTRRLPMRFKWGIFCFLALVLLAGGIAYWKLTAPPSLQNDATLLAKSQGSTLPEIAEDKSRRKLLGVWQDDYRGKRTLTLNEDGSGTMLVELSGLASVVFASKLRFDMEWSLQGTKLPMKSVGGEPADKVNLILNTMGNTAEDSILEISDDRLLLLDRNGTTRYDWRRVKKDEASME
jgi:hypothetical protein